MQFFIYTCAVGVMVLAITAGLACMLCAIWWPDVVLLRVFLTAVLLGGVAYVITALTE
jgi:hypothetical protein